MRAPEPLPLSESWSRRLFAEIVARPEESVDLGEAVLLIACEEYPNLDVPSYMARLDLLAASLRDRLGPGGDPLGLVLGINRYLFVEQGFRGNVEDYYDPRNSYLNDVLDRRVGIPISLSTVYLEVARRLGLKVHGVGLPGHFVVRIEFPHGGLLVDPFHAGEILTNRDCQKRLDRIYGGGVTLEPRMLAPRGTKHILARTLRNLKVIHTKAGNHVRALGIVDLLLGLNPESTTEVRDRGLLYSSLECYSFAARDLETYLALAPTSPEAPALKEKIADLRHKAARLN
jgi:regulator of sirC expression with transglutaminase-like and TPR domain